MARCVILGCHPMRTCSALNFARPLDRPACDRIGEILDLRANFDQRPLNGSQSSYSRRTCRLETVGSILRPHQHLEQLAGRQLRSDCSHRGTPLIVGSRSIRAR